MVGYKLAIVIPALNEEASIRGVVSRLLKYGVPIVIDDGSKDLTGDVASEAGAIVIRHQANKGYDDAINSGFECAEKLGFEIVITMDADGQHDETMITKFAEEIVAGAEVVIGIRNVKPRIAERLFAFIAKAKWGIDDPLCGFKAYGIKPYQKLGFFDTYGSIGTELAIFAAKNQYKIKQIPVQVKPRFNGDSPRFGGSLKANFLILRSLLLALRSK